MDEETACCVGFSVFPGIGPARFKLLKEYFGSVKAAWQAPASTLKYIKLGDKLTDSFDRFRSEFSIPEYFKKLKTLNVTVLTRSDPRYPALLNQISDAPIVLYVKGKRGERPLNLKRTMAIVGTRKITPYGREVTRKIAEGLVAYGFTIISGMAYGVDAVAHQSALDAGGNTIAVLGCGIDVIAPPSNANLYHEIASGGHGAIISEMPLGLRPNKGLFPARNRIISGLSLGVVVTEGANDSGALITARYAGEQGREVMAVPGPVTSEYSRGPSKLIKSGATLVESADDVIEALGLDIKSRKNQLNNMKINQSLSEEEQAIINNLSDGRLYIDDLIRRSNLTISTVTATLTVLEIRGIVRDYGEKMYGLTEV